MSETTSGSITETIYLETRELILSGDYRPGQVLTAPALRNLFELKTVYAPRDALNALAVDGYLDLDVELGFRVRSWTPTLVDRQFTSFANLQRIALARTMERAADDVLAAFARETEVRESGNMGGEAALKAYHVFHGALVRMSRIPRLAETGSRIVPAAFHRLAWVSASTSPALAGRWTWSEIAASMATREVDRAAALLRKRIMVPRAAVVARATQMSVEPPSSRPADIRRIDVPPTSQPDMAFVTGATPWGITMRDRPSLVPVSSTSAGAGSG